MFHRISDYFLKEYLETENDVVNRFRIRMVYRTILSALLIISVALIIYIREGYPLEIYRTVFLIIPFGAGLFYIRAKKDIIRVSHFLLLLAYCNYLWNIFFFFQTIDSVITLLAVINVIFAFHILGQRWGVVYFVMQIIPALIIIAINSLQIHYINYVPKPPNGSEQLVTGVVVSLVFAYLLYQYQEAFRVAKMKLEETLKDLQEAKHNGFHFDLFWKRNEYIYQSDRYRNRDLK